MRRNSAVARIARRGCIRRVRRAVPIFCVTSTSALNGYVKIVDCVRNVRAEPNSRVCCVAISARSVITGNVSIPYRTVGLNVRGVAASAYHAQLIVWVLSRRVLEKNTLRFAEPAKFTGMFIGCFFFWWGIS